MKRLIWALAACLTFYGCATICQVVPSVCNPTPAPTPTPTPPPVCPENCGHGMQCLDPAVGCVPIPAPGVVCQPGETCGCWVLPPDEPAWRELTCKPRDGFTVSCIDNLCVYTQIPPPPPPPEDPVSVADCPKPLAPGAYIIMKNKPYGHGQDSTVRVHGDVEFCRIIHGVSVNDCHLEGWPKRSECEMELLGGCPIWQYKSPQGDAFLCQQEPAEVSCDHFGNVEFRDDPRTPLVFEGQPKECGEQRDGRGDPMAGFFVIAHGKSELRACRPDGQGCGPWRPFDH